MLLTFTLRNVFDGAIDSYYLNGKLIASAPQTSDFTFMSWALVDVELVNSSGPFSGGATFSNFSYTPLT